jgi:MFS family permease
VRSREPGEYMVKGMRLALIVIGVAYLLLALVVAYFAMNLGQSPNIGAAYLAVGIVAWGGTIAATGLFAGSVLGTLALVRHSDSRRPLYLLAILGGWIGALVLAWLAWEFWSHS